MIGKMALFVSLAFVASSASAESWGKAVIVNSSGSARSEPTSTLQNGVTYDALSSDEDAQMAAFLAVLNGRSKQALIPETARISIFTGDFPKPASNGHLLKTSMPLNDVREVLSGCTFGPIQSLGHDGGMAFGMAEFQCSTAEVQWKRGAVGFTLQGGNIYLAVNNGDLSNILFTDKKAAN